MKKEIKTPIQTSLNKIAYLFGNGINRVTNDASDRYEWENFLEDLNDRFANKNIRNIQNKAFPLVFDEIVSCCKRIKNKSESEIRMFIQEKLQWLVPNPKHDYLPFLNFDEILTTNYDYLIEQNLQPGWERSHMTKTEYSYSIFRHQKVANKRVWHIHGEQADRRSILLGYRHYINYCSKVQKEFNNCVDRIVNNVQATKDSWINRFLTHNLYIVGLGMKNTEYPLWWLLAERMNKKNRDRRLNINNEIYYVIPEFSKDKSSDTVDHLQAYGVKILEIDVPYGDYYSFYEKVLRGNYCTK